MHLMHAFAAHSLGDDGQGVVEDREGLLVWGLHLDGFVVGEWLLI